MFVNKRYIPIFQYSLPDLIQEIVNSPLPGENTSEKGLKCCKVLLVNFAGNESLLESPLVDNVRKLARFNGLYFLDIDERDRTAVHSLLRYLLLEVKFQKIIIYGFLGLFKSEKEYLQVQCFKYSFLIDFLNQIVKDSHIFQLVESNDFQRSLTDSNIVPFNAYNDWQAFRDDSDPRLASSNDKFMKLRELIEKSGFVFIEKQSPTPFSIISDVTESFVSVVSSHLSRSGELN